MVSTVPAESLKLEQRYETLKTLGQGGAGAVYLASDRDTGEQVALKKLLRMDARSVLRLKREFRSLADMHHPNLVKLYDLGHAADGWYLTMEFVDGPDLLSYLGFDPERALASDVSTTREHGVGAAHAAFGHGRTLGAFHQLACGVRALHAAGMLHRDLKPSNVLVARDRVVVLDFGLVRELDADEALATQDDFISGTPAYMAPEQAQSLALSEASDWYAFGVMLYQVLSGVLPIEGRSSLELLMRKSELDPTPLDRLVPDVSGELNALCMALLQREPLARPSGAEIVAALERERAAFAGRDDAPASLEFTVRTATAAHKRSGSLVGREPELLQLRAALETAAQGSAVMMHVRGASGAGKSTLVEHFVARLDSDPLSSLREAPLVLRSRCYEREAMPFKALDGVMDALIKHLAQLDDFERGHLLPTELAELTQLFPALQRLKGVEQLLAIARPRSDRPQTRRRAELGLRELFARLAARRPLVLWIDDLQWGDLDSATILRSWRRELAQAPILFVFSYRGDEVTTSECLSSLLARESDPSLPTPSMLDRVIELASLEALDLRLLCEQRLGELAGQRPDLVARIAHESRGNPFLVAQLAALVQARLALGDHKLESLTIEELVVQTRELLPHGAAELLNTLAIAGRPLPPKLALRAARIHMEGRALLHALRGLRLIRSRDIGGIQHIEVYHDRVREGVQAALDAPERARLNESLMRVLEAEGAADADWLHSLALGAGLRSQALQHGRVAAERAAAVLAFERAAELYATCLQLTEGGADERRALYQLRANALARARRGVDAADAYLEAAKLSTGEAAVALMRSASSHLIRCGEYARGEAIAREVLLASRASLPASEAGLLAAIAWERAALAMRGLAFEPRAEPIPSELKLKIDLFATLSIEHQAFDPLRATLMQARSLRWALASGDRRLVARALCLSATMICVTGSERAERKSREMLERATALAQELQDEALFGNTLAARAICSFLLGRPGDVIECSYEAERISRAHSQGDSEGDYYHRFTVVAVRIGALQIQGEHLRAQAELQSTLQEARATDNRSAALHLALVQTFMDEVQNRPASAKPRLMEQRRALPPGSFGPLHMMHMMALMRASCATADFGWAGPWIDEDWARWKRSPVRASAFLTLLARGAHARYVLNRHVIERGSGDPAKLVREDLRALGRLPYASWRIGGQCRTLARLAFLAGDRAGAARNLRECIAQIQQVGAIDEESRDRYALGFVVGGQEGASLRAASEREMRARGVVEPLAEVQAHYPELILAASPTDSAR